jgi:NAD(P)H-dependent FMN reductase
MPTSVPTKQRIAVVIGSTRPTRICGAIAAWSRDAIQDGSELAYELLDLAQVELPFLDEPLKAALHQYEHEHTRAWSQCRSACIRSSLKYVSRIIWK